MLEKTARISIMSGHEDLSTEYLTQFGRALRLHHRVFVDCLNRDRGLEEKPSHHRLSKCNAPASSSAEKLFACGVWHGSED